MRIGDWSSDVCSSDLPSNSTFSAALRTKMPMNADFDFLSTAAMRESLPPCCRAMRIDGLQNRRSREISTRDALPEDRLLQSAQRSEERGVGKECVSTCRSRCTTYH